MLNEYLALDTAPCLSIRYPDCDACCVEVESDGDGFVCPSCGTYWGYEDGEDVPGTLVGEWSGEKPEGPKVSNNNAWLVARKTGSARFEEAERISKEGW